MICQYGQMVVLISGLPTNQATQSGKNEPFSASALEAVAYQILLRASQQMELTGVSAEQSIMGVNGHILPKNALSVAGQTYVPVVEFAKAMGLTTRWNNKTGALTLSSAGHKSVALMAGSTAATVGGAKAAALTVPVLKQGG